MLFQFFPFQAAASSVLLTMLVQACVSWPILVDWVVKEPLKRQELKQRGNTELQHRTVVVDSFFAQKACKSILAATQNKTMNLKMSMLWA